MKRSWLLIITAALSMSALAQTVPYTKGRIAMSSDGNHHDQDDWGASIATLAIIASQGLQHKLCLYTYSDHVWGNGSGTATGVMRYGDVEMHESVIHGGLKFGYNTSDTNIFVEAVSYPSRAYIRMAEEILNSTAENPLTIIAAGPMEVLGQGLDLARDHADWDTAKNHVRVISHSNWNDVHSGIHHTPDGTRNDGLKDTEGVDTQGWTWYRTSIANPGTWYYQNPTANYFVPHPTKDAGYEAKFPPVIFTHIADQNSANSTTQGFATHFVNTTAKNHPDNFAPWYWMRDYSNHTAKITAPTGIRFNPNEAIKYIYERMDSYWPDLSDCGMAYYLFSTNPAPEKGGPLDMKDMFDKGFDADAASLISVDINGGSAPSTFSGKAVLGSAGDTWNPVVGLGVNAAAWKTTGLQVDHLKLVDGTASTVNFNLKYTADAVNDAVLVRNFGLAFNASATDVDIPSSLANLRRDYFYINHGTHAHPNQAGPDAHFTMTLTGLSVDTEYKLVLYAGGNAVNQGVNFSNFSSAVTAQDGLFTAVLPASPATQKTSPVLGEDYIVVEFTTGSSQTELSFDAGYNGVGTSGISGFQLLQVSVATRNAPPVGTFIGLKAEINEMYVSARSNLVNGPLIANRFTVGSWEKFMVEDAGGGLIALKANANDRYVCADKLLNSDDWPLVANRTKVGAWETFEWIENADGTLSLKASGNGMFVSVDGGDGGRLKANSDAIGASEKFTWDEF